MDYENEEEWAEAASAARTRRWRVVAIVAVIGLILTYSGIVLLDETPMRDVPTRDEAAAGDPEPLIDPDEITSGGVPMDGIPPIDRPRFQDAADVDWLEPQEPVISLEVGGEVRAYPLQILTWHEIVNDMVGDVPVTVTFCPLCNTAYAFERPEVNGETTSFGTSGKLYLSNLVMYDRATESYWPQAMGRAVVGPLTGTTLDRLPAQIVSWEEFRSSFPDAQVLSRDTGHDRPYGSNPYVGYDDIEEPPFLFEGEVDGRLAPVERVLGVEVESDVIAFPYFELQRAAEDGAAAVNVDVAEKPIAVFWKKGTVSALDAQEIAASRDVGSSFAFFREVDGRKISFEIVDGAIVDLQTSSRWDVFGRAVAGPMKGAELEEADAHDSFWFDWAAFHPETEVWGLRED